jgi:predicted metal-dependent HD superfamily phosphohydrolase
MATRERWAATWQGLNLEPPEDAYEDLSARYSESHRAYHTLHHLFECFTQFDRARSLAERPFEVEIALWFHDVIYDPQGTDSEDRSAAVAAQALAGAGAFTDQQQRVCDLILATKHTSSKPAGDEALLLDTDLSILGAPRPRFVEYESQVRQEYSWVPDEMFRKARAAILTRFLERPRIYSTDVFADFLEEPARANLRFSLASLAG